MDLTGLSSITTPEDLTSWLQEKCVSPIRPSMTGGDIGAIMGKIIEVVPRSSNGIKVYNVEDFGAVHDGVTDDTAAIQAAINAADAAGGGIVYFPNGVYALNSPVYDSDSNSQLIVPVHTFADSVTNNHIKLLGEIAPNYYSQPFSGGTAPPNTGVILKSNLSGAINVIASKSSIGAWGNFNYCHLEIENITIRLKSKTGSTDIAPAGTAINASRLAYLSILNVRIDTESNQANIVQPLSSSRGIVCPATNNFVLVNIDKCYVEGVYTAFELYEHASLDNIFIDGCYEGISFNTSNHPALINKICIARTKINIVVKGVMPFSINQLAIENFFGSGRWIDNLYDLDERVSGSPAYIRWNRVISNVGIANDEFVRSSTIPSTIATDVISSSTSRLVISNQKTAAYTLTAQDAFKLVSINNAANSALTIQANSAESIPTGIEVTIVQLGAGSIDVTGDTGVVIYSNGDKYSTNGVGAVAKLLKMNTNTWLLTGDLLATGRGGGDPISSAPDTDAQAFISAAGITNSTEQNAVNNLVVALKAASLWSKLHAIYPFVGSTESACSYNLKNTAQFQLVFFGAKTFDATGYKPDGTTSYANTGLNPSVNMAGLTSSFHISCYNGLTTNNGGSYMGAYNGGVPITQMELAYSGNTNYTSINSSRSGTVYHNCPAVGAFKGFWVANRNSSSGETIDKDGALFSSSDYAAINLPNANIYLAANNKASTGLAADFSNPIMGFASIGEGFTDSEKSQFATAVNSFISALSR